MAGNRGFTLIEVIVVASIIAILAGILVPMIFNQIDEAKISRAQTECKSISSAMLMFRKETGKWPYYVPDCSGTYSTLQTGTGNLPASAAGWQINSNAIPFGVILNLPGQGITGALQSCYNGKAQSYLMEDKPDPWGNMYIVNTANFVTDGPVWVISAGPNGQLETSVNSPTLNDLIPSGDDIGVRLK